MQRLKNLLEEKRKENEQVQGQLFQYENTVETLEEKMAEKETIIDNMREDFKHLIDFKNELESLIEDLNK